MALLEALPATPSAAFFAAALGEVALPGLARVGLVTAEVAADCEATEARGREAAAPSAVIAPIEATARAPSVLRLTRAAPTPLAIAAGDRRAEEEMVGAR